MELNDQWQVAMAVSHYSMGSLAAARYEEGVEKARAGMELFSKIGDVAEVHFAHLHLTFHLCRLGRLDEAFGEANELLHSCVRHHDNYVSIWTILVLLRSSLGQLPFDELLGAVQLLPGNNLGSTMMLMAEGYWHRHHQRTEDALSKFEEVWRICRQKRCLTTFNMSFEYAQSLLIQGRFEKELGDPNVEEGVRIAQTEIDRIERAIREALQAGEGGTNGSHSSEYR